MLYSFTVNIIEKAHLWDKLGESFLSNFYHWKENVRKMEKLARRFSFYFPFFYFFLPNLWHKRCLRSHVVHFYCGKNDLLSTLGHSFNVRVCVCMRACAVEAKAIIQ